MQLSALPGACLQPGVLSLVMVGVIIIRVPLVGSGAGRKALNVGFLCRALFCPPGTAEMKMLLCG